MIDNKSLDDLTIDIQAKRSEMYLIANQYGYSHERTLKNSQELDQLIIEYQKYMSALNRTKALYIKIYYHSSYRKCMKFKV